MLNFSLLFSEDWILAATEFAVKESVFTTEAEKSSLEIVSTQIPSLILDSIPVNINRTVFPEEKFERELFKLKKDRQSLYSSLTNQIKSRDSLIFSYSGIELKKKIENSDKTIKNTVNKIKESELNETQLIKNFNLNKKSKETLEKVIIYQNDSSKLYNLEDAKSKDKINSDSIYGLVTGNITSYENYIKVEATLTLYPNGKVLSYAKEVGHISEVEFISNSIANQFLSFIINDELAQTDIFIYPPEAGENAIIYIEDYVLKGKSVSTSFTPGEHSIRVESPGYETIYFSHKYLAKENKTISINMKKIEQVNSFFVIDSKKDKTQFDLSSEIYLNSLYQGSSPISVLISDKTYLGEVVSKNDNDVYSFFVLKNGYNSETLQNQKIEKKDSSAVALQINIPEAKENLSKKIDKSRKRMYWSYGGLLLSLPLHYFTKGTYELCQENSSVIDSSKLQTWKTASNITMYTAIGAGVNFLVQLILYLVDANKVVPKTIEPTLLDTSDVEKLNFEIEDVRQKEEIKFQQELELQKKLEEEKRLEEEKNSLSEHIDSKNYLEENSSDSFANNFGTEISENEYTENSSKDKEGE